MTEHFSTRFLKNITAEPGDPTFSILKAHLLIEDLIRTFLENKAKNPASIKKAKLSFAQALQVARAFCEDVSQDHWIWKAMTDLNRLRNDLAHNLDPDELENKIEAYISYVVSSVGIPLPEPLTPVEYAEKLTTAQLSGRPTLATYYKIDMANIGLYSCVLGALGFEAESNALSN